MRWTEKPPIPEGTKRTVEKFAWWPTPMLGHGHPMLWLWLETYYEDQLRTAGYWEAPFADDLAGRFVPARWEMVRRRPAELQGVG